MRATRVLLFILLFTFCTVPFALAEDKPDAAASAIPHLEFLRENAVIIDGVFDPIGQIPAGKFYFQTKTTKTAFVVWILVQVTEDRMVVPDGELDKMVLRVKYTSADENGEIVVREWGNAPLLQKILKGIDDKRNEEQRKEEKK